MTQLKSGYTLTGIQVISEFSSAQGGVCTPMYLGNICYAHYWHRVEV